MNQTQSKNILSESQKFIPGGVNSPVRAFKGVGGTPPVIHSAKGSRIKDIDGNEYIDYIGSWGPMILGYSHPEVNQSLIDCIPLGTSFGAPTKKELEIAKLITEMVPGIEMVRLVNSGTEATMSAVRLARGYTGRKKIIKFEGCYHGHYDGFLIKAGSGVLTLGIPGSPGVPDEIAGLTCIAEFNSIDSVIKVIEDNPGEIAGLIIEPVPGNMGCISPDREFLSDLRKVCTDNGILLIFDEVMSGFRVSKGGAQELYNIHPDITALGKIIGGGLPIGAYGASKEIMEHIAPSGNIYQAGTLSGNPVAVTAGLKTLELLNQPGVYEELENKGKFLEEKIHEMIQRTGYPLTFNRVGSMFTLFFTREQITDYKTAQKADTDKFTLFFHEMLKRGIYMAPSQFESAFISLSHTKEDLLKTCEATEESLKAIFK